MNDMNRMPTEDEIMLALQNKEEQRQELIEHITEMHVNLLNPGKIPAEISSRGFLHLPEIPGSYGGTVRVYESSSAEHPHIWLRATQPSDLNNPNSELIDAAQHMPVEGAKLLRDQLDYLINQAEEG